MAHKPLNSSFELLAVAAVLVVGVLSSLLFGYLSAMAGVLLAVLTSLFAIWIKGWAVRKNIDAAMLTLGVTFGIRLLTVGAGIAVASRFDAQYPLVFGFFGAFVFLMVIEMASVVRAAKALQASRLEQGSAS